MAITLSHFKRAIEDIGAHGDNDTLPFDTDNRFIADNPDELAELAFRFSQELKKAGKNHARNLVEGLIAVARQRRHFDARIPDALTEDDKSVALSVATNLRLMLREIGSRDPREAIVRSPVIPGYEWIASGVGDFSIGSTLIEVKCTGKHFSSSDYRQILMYWILSYAAALESGGREFTEGVLVNPRLNRMVRLSFRELPTLLGAGRSKVELLEVFGSLVANRSGHFVA